MRCGVFTSSRDKAELLFRQIEEERPDKVLSKVTARNKLRMVFPDETSFEWVDPTVIVPRARFNRIWIDAEIGDDVKRTIIYPLLTPLTGERFKENIVLF